MTLNTVLLSDFSAGSRVQSVQEGSAGGTVEPRGEHPASSALVLLPYDSANEAALLVQSPPLSAF